MRISPALNGGQYGWCVGVEESPGSLAGGGCAMVPLASAPLAMELTSGSLREHHWSVVLLTTPRVSAVLVNGHRLVPTTALTGLPYRLRAARILIPIPARKTVHRGLPRPPEPTIVALDAQGQPIPAPRTREPAEPPNPSGHGPCALHADGLTGLTAQWSHVASVIRPFPGQLVGRAFFSCIDTEYYLRGWPLDAAILLDAAKPGATPAAIPGLTPVKGEHAYFNGPGDFNGELTATRYGNAWLIVAGGSGLAQRVDVLRHLTPTINL